MSATTRPRRRAALLATLLGVLALAGLPAGVAHAVGPQDPGVLTVQTVPPVPGARVSADGSIATADEDGIARLPVRHFERLDERFNAPRTKVADDRRVMFDRIRGQMHNAFDGRAIEVGLRTERLVRWSFVDREGLPISPAELTELVLRSSTGEQLRLTGSDIGKQRWLAASRTQQTSTGLMSKDIYWTVQSVKMAGAELVNRSQQRFVPDQGTQWQIALLFYRAQVRAADLLFGTPAGEGVEVIGPDGTVTRYPMDDEGNVTLPAVARGEYQMTVYGSGISFVRPVSVSRDQNVELLVISRLDIAMIGLTLLVIAVGLVLVGRRRRLASWAADRRTRPTPEPARTGALLGLVGALLGLSLAVQAGAAPSAAAGPAPLAGAPTAGHATNGTTTEDPTAANPVPAATAAPVPLLAYYYIWFTPTSWNRAKTDYPLLGRYSSDDEVIMARHIDTAMASGIDGFLVSWKRTPQLNQRLAKLTQVAAQRGFKLGIVYQGLDFSREPLPATQVAEDLAWFADTYADHATFHVLDDQPLVVWTGTGRFSTEDVAAVTEPVATRLHVLASAKNVPDYERVARWVDGNAYYWSSVRPEMRGYAAKLQAMSDAVHADAGLWIAPFAPGFDARLVGGSSEVPRNGGQTLRRQLEAAQASNPDVLGLISWNEFSENTHVEPSEEHGTTALHALALALGATPPPAPADSSDPLETHAGVTGWGALVVIGLLLGLLNLVILWRGRNGPRPATAGGTVPPATGREAP